MAASNPSTWQIPTVDEAPTLLTARFADALAYAAQVHVGQPRTTAWVAHVESHRRLGVVGTSASVPTRGLDLDLLAPAQCRVLASRCQLAPT